MSTIVQQNFLNWLGVLFIKSFIILINYYNFIDRPPRLLCCPILQYPYLSFFCVLMGIQEDLLAAVRNCDRTAKAIG